jgi:excisionase family DNA binding protein
MLSLAEAAQRVGLHRSNLLRAIKAGRISGTRDDSGAWRIDAAELVRVYGDLRSATLQPAQGDALLELKLEHAERLICELTRRAERAEREADEWREQAKRIALPAPSASHQLAQPPEQPSRFRRAWRWMRATG